MLGQMTRRQILSLGTCGALSHWFATLAAHAAEQPTAKSCILLWMAGGPSHLDTFDLKPEAPAEVRGEFRPIETAVAGIQISEHFPRFAKSIQHAAVLRSMSTVESDHQLATFHLHTGYQKRAGGLVHPSLGAIVARELGQREFALPEYVCIGGGSRHAMRSGFLGPEFQPLDVTNPDRGTHFLDPLTSDREFERQFQLLRRLEDSFHGEHRVEPVRAAHRSTLERAVRLMKSEQKQAFDLSEEPEAVRDRYGRGSFGQGCLMAKRLIESDVRFVEVLMGDGVGWDTHRDNFPRTRALSEEVDLGLAALVSDLETTGRLDSTLIIWMGEFGRSPQITSGGGRNHWARAWSTVLIGGGIRGGQVIGRTDRDAAEVLQRPVSVVDFLATICAILGIDYTRQYRAPGIDRPIPIVDTSKPVSPLTELL